MPPSELQRKLQRLRARLRGLVLLSGASRVVLAAVGILAGALLLDWATKLDSPGRIIVLAAALGGLGAALWRFLIAPLRLPMGNEELALLVERRFPTLRDRLISTVQLSRAADVAPLSNAMVQALSAETVYETSALDFADVTSGRRPRIWLTAAVVAVAAASAYSMLFPASAAIFVCRFFDPLSSVEWPRRTQLTVLAYDKDGHQLAVEGTRVFVPKGEDLNLLVRAASFSGNLWRPPRRVAVHYRFAAGGGGRRSVPVGEQATYRTCFPGVTEPFTFRASGDDAATETYEVDVRDRPRIEEIRITLRAPPYTGESERVQADGRGAIVALAGSVASIAVRSNKPISPVPGSATLQVNGQPPIPLTFVTADAYADARRRAAEEGSPLPPYDHDPTRLHGSFALRLGQKHYAVSLVDTDGLTNSPPATYRLDVRPDRPPVVKLPEPGASKKVTPRATVPIHVLAQDDYLVCATRFLYQRGQKGPPVTHAFPAPSEPAKKAEQTLEWDLTTLALKEGDIVQVHAEAEDSYTEESDGKTLGPNVGRSKVYRLTVIGEAEMASLLERRQQQLKERLRKLIGRQEAGKATTEHLAQADKADRRRIGLAEREQRKAAASATHIADELKSVLSDMKHNKVGSPVDHERVDGLEKPVRQAGEKDMPDAARRIAKAAQTDDRAEQRQRLADAATRQQQVIDSLRAALTKFDQWHDVDELIREASKLLLTEKKLAERTTALARDLLGKPADALTPAEKGSVQSLSRAQQAARDTMHGLETRMAEVAEKIRAKDPAAAKLVDQALAQAGSEQIRKRMDDAARAIQGARPATALPHQTRAIDSLKKLIETLSRARSPLLARDLRQLQEEVRKRMEAIGKLLENQRRLLTETQVNELRRRLGQLRDQHAATQQATRKAPAGADLSKQAESQKAHAKAAEELGRQLQRVDPPDDGQKKALAKTADAMAKAQQQMANATQSLAQGKRDEATGSQKKADEELEKADSQLADLQSQLAKDKKPSDRLPQRAKEQGETAKATRKAGGEVKKTAEKARKTLPTAGKAIEQASKHADGAARSMDSAKQQLDQAAKPPAPQAEKQAGQHQEQAKEQLEKTLEELAKAHEELDLRRRVQKLFELRKALSELLPRQVAIREATAKLDADTEGGQKPPDHAQTLKMRELADEQADAQKDAQEIIGHLEREDVPVFLYVMRDATRLMAEVHKRLAEQKVDWATQESQREIERDLLQLLEAMKSEAQRLAKKEQQQGGRSGGGAGGQPQPLVAPLHQLKQLRALQLQINKGTRAIEIDRATTGGVRERILRLRAKRLGTRQAELGKLSRTFADVLEKRKEKASLNQQ